jgi:hypothetical protein
LPLIQIVQTGVLHPTARLEDVKKKILLGETKGKGMMPQMNAWGVVEHHTRTRGKAKKREKKQKQSPKAAALKGKLLYHHAPAAHAARPATGTEAAFARAFQPVTAASIKAATNGEATTSHASASVSLPPWLMHGLQIGFLGFIVQTLVLCFLAKFVDSGG